MTWWTAIEASATVLVGGKTFKLLVWKSSTLLSPDLHRWTVHRDRLCVGAGSVNGMGQAKRAATRFVNAHKHD